MKKESLVGGTPSSFRLAKAKRARLEEENAPPQIGIRFIAILALCGALFTGLGYYKVDSVFSARDFQIEAGRLQELAQQRRDRSKALVSRVSQLQRSEHMRASAVANLGMLDPQPVDMESLVVPTEVSLRWQRAAAEASIEFIAKEPR